MTMTLSMMVTANSKQAQAELAKLDGVLEKTGASAVEVGTKGKTGTAQLTTGARQAAVSVQGMSAAQQTAVGTANQLAVANRGAAGSMGNLIAQFNDVGVMLAAGQNPLQLALQQGTQITQVIGPMGAAGAVRALGGALIGMLNPVSLFTIGAIAAGAAVFQWATASVEVKTLADQVVSLEEAMSSYKEIADLASASTQDLEDRFGSAAVGIQQTVQMLELISRNEAQRTIDGIASSLSELMGIRGDGDNRTGVADFFDVSIGLAFTDTQRAAREEARLLTAEFVSQQDALRGAAGDLDAQIAIMQQIIATTQQLAAAKDGVSAEEEALLKDMGQTLLLMQEQRGSVESVNDALRDQSQIQQQLQTEFQNFLTVRKIAEADLATAAWQTIAQLQQQADMQAIIMRYGADSQQAVKARISAERAAFVELQRSKGVAGELLDQMLEVWDAANGLAAVNMASNIAAGADQASRMANELGRAVSNAITLANQGVGDVERARINYEFRDDPLGRAGALARAEFDSKTDLPSGGQLPDGAARYIDEQREDFVSARVEAERYNQSLQQWRKEQAAAARTSSAGGSSGRRGSRTEIDQVAQLTDRMRDELAVLRETDPVQKELLRNREALATATDAERETISDLIGQRIEETRTLEVQEAQWNLMASTASEALDALIVQGESLSDVLKKVISNLIDAGIEAATLGTGPLAELFGGTNSSGRGGWVGDVFGAVFGGAQKKADGGMIYGPGTGTSDSVPIWSSSGEFVVNAAATAKNRALLEAINAGNPIASFAKGGAVNGSRSSGTGSASGATVAHFTLDLRGAQGNTEIQEASYRGMQQALAEFSRSVLPERMQQIQADPRMIG